MADQGTFAVRPISEFRGIDSDAGSDELGGQPLLIPIPKAAPLLGISRSAAYRCAACGGTPIRHLRGRVYIVTAKLRVLLEAG